MVLSTRRGSRRATQRRPRRPDPGPVPETSPGSAAPRRSLATSTAAPPPAAAAPDGHRRGPPPQHRARPRPRPWVPGAADGREAQAYQAGDGSCAPRPPQCAPRSRRSAGLGGARARRRRRLRSYCPRFCRRRGPAPRWPPSPPPRSRPRAHHRGLPLGSARGPRAGAHGPGVAREPGPPRSSTRAARVPAGMRPRARGASPRLAPARTRTRAAAGTRGAGPAPPPGPSPPAQLAARSAPPLQQQQAGRVRVWGARAAELGRVGNAGAGRGRGPTPPAAPPRHVLPLFPPRPPQLRAAGALSALSPPGRRGASPG